MSEIVAIVEGQTEQTFVRDQLAEHLGARGAAIWAVLSGKSRRHGGVRKWASARGDILRTLKEGRYVTTMFDFYAMPTDWPGREEAARLPWDKRGDHVEQAIIEDVKARLDSSFDDRQLIPYIQMHEFEALVFADVGVLAEKTDPLSMWPVGSLKAKFQEILDEAGDPEAINDSYETCPSRRITGHVSRYRKKLNGPIITKAIGLETLRRECTHFDEWVARLEAVCA